MNKKRLGLTIFFIVLTLSIGLVSVNSSLSSVNAQNSALSQDRHGDDGKQNTDLSQSSNQKGQVVTGDTSILSGNNLLCKDQDNSKIEQDLTNICTLDEINPPSGGETAILNLTIFVQSGFCEIRSCSFLVEYGGTERIQRDISSSSSQEFNIPVNANFAVIVHGNQFDHLRGAVKANSDCTVLRGSGEIFICQGTKNSQPTEIFVAIDRRE